MNKTDYISVSEFAKLAGISRQQVYNKMRTELSSFVEEFDNKKMLKIEVLQTLGVKKVSNKFELSSEVDTLNRLIDFIKSENGQLNEQLQVKDEHIKTLSEQLITIQSELAAERQHSRELSDKITVIADQAQQLQLAQMSVSEPTKMIEEQPTKKHWWQKNKNKGE